MTRWTRVAAVPMGLLAIMLFVPAWVDASPALVALALAFAGSCLALVRASRRYAAASVAQLLAVRAVVNLVLLVVLLVLAFSW